MFFIRRGSINVFFSRNQKWFLFKAETLFDICLSIKVAPKWIKINIIPHGYIFLKIFPQILKKNVFVFFFGVWSNKVTQFTSEMTHIWWKISVILKQLKKTLLQSYRKQCFPVFCCHLLAFGSIMSNSNDL